MKDAELTLEAERRAPSPLPFNVTFDSRDEDELLRRWRVILRSNRWSDGDNTREFEALWSAECGADAIAVDNWSGGALAVLDFIDVRGETVLSPSNTFLATPRSAMKSGAKVVYYDCNRSDLCGSYEDFVSKAEAHRPKAACRSTGRASSRDRESAGTRRRSARPPALSGRWPGRGRPDPARWRGRRRRSRDRNRSAARSRHWRPRKPAR